MHRDDRYADEQRHQDKPIAEPEDAADAVPGPGMLMPDCPDAEGAAADDWGQENAGVALVDATG